MKKVFRYLFPVILTTFSLSSCKKEEHYLTLIGYDGFKNYSTNAIFLAAEDINLKPNVLLSRTKSSYREDLKVIEEDPYVFTSTTKYLTSDIIKKSHAVLFSYRLKDVLANFTDIDEYDLTLKKKDFELLDYYLELTFDEYSSKYKNKVGCIGVYNELSLEAINPIIDEINALIKDKAQAYNFSFIDSSFLDEYIENGTLKDTGLHLLSKGIKDFYRGKSS